MKNIVTWMKKNALWILSGIASILAIIFAVKYEKEKVKQLKIDHEIEKNKAETIKLECERDKILDHETELSKQDATIQESVEAINKKLLELETERKKLDEDLDKEKTSEQISDEFNSRYKENDPGKI